MIHDEQGHAHFVTFSCYKRRNMLSLQETKRIVVGTLGAQITKHKTKLVGFVIMPNHVHVLVWFGDGGRISPFMRDWKRETSYKIKKFLRNSEYARRHDLREPVWQPRYHDFNVVSREKILEKLNYMHNNPVAANLADTPCEYRFSSALWYEKGQSVGVRIECM
ncbi:MAG: transposase [Planctomycetes bacterium]|nr:transposase [Planctomycetota bacterium]